MPSPSVSPIIATMSAGEARRASILVVDDEPTISEVVARYLDRAGYAVRTAADGPGAVAAANATRPDLVVLDIMLPGLRRARGDAPTARGPRGARRRDPADSEGRGVRSRPRASPRRRRLRRQAVLAGELRRPRRGRAASRRRPGADERRAAGVRRAGDRPRRVGRCRSVTAPVELTQREFDLLHFLARHPGQVFSRDQLMDRVWQFPLLHRHDHGHRPRPTRAREDRAGPGASALDRDGVGRRLPLPAEDAMRVSLAIALAAGLLAGAVIAPVYGAEPGLVTGVLVERDRRRRSRPRAPDRPRGPRSDRFACASRGWRRSRSA